MKKILLPVSIVLLCMLFAQNRVYSQTMRNSIKLNSFKELQNDETNAASALLPTDKSMNAEASGVSLKAIKYFNKEFKDATSVHWYKISDGFIATCLVNGKKSRMYYDRKSHWTGTIFYYFEKDLPRDIRALVKSTYYDYTITIVEEVHIADKVIYRIHLEDENSWKTISIDNEEMNVVEDLRKTRQP